MRLYRPPIIGEMHIPLSFFKRIKKNGSDPKYIFLLKKNEFVFQHKTNDQIFRRFIIKDETKRRCRSDL